MAGTRVDHESGTFSRRHLNLRGINSNLRTAAPTAHKAPARAQVQRLPAPRAKVRSVDRLPASLTRALPVPWPGSSVCHPRRTRPLAGRAGRLCRLPLLALPARRTGPERMILVTRLLPPEPNVGPWLAADRAVWGIGSRLRERLDVWPGESACRVRRRSAIGLRTMFRRFTYTLFLEWRPAADACAQDEHRPLGLRKAQSHRSPRRRPRARLSRHPRAP